MKHNSKQHLSHDTIFVYIFLIKKIGDLSNTSFFSLDSIEHIYIYIYIYIILHCANYGV
jgi:hypothetical protein